MLNSDIPKRVFFLKRYSNVIQPNFVAISVKLNECWPQQGNFEYLQSIWKYIHSNECRVSCAVPLTHWGRVTHICVSKLTIIGSDNGLSPGQRQANIRTNARLLLIGPLGTNFSEILIAIQTFSLKKMHLKMSSAKCRLSRLGLNELILVNIGIGMNRK